jgi:ribosomal protein S18 acetylase RimI-like enzyme
MNHIRSYTDADFPNVDALWKEVFPGDPPWNRAAEAIPAKLAVQPELLLVAVSDGKPVGTVMAGYDGHRGWLYAVAVAVAHQRSGIGTMLVREAEQRVRALGCEKVNLQVRASNQAVISFYRGLGYEVEERVSMGKRYVG